MKKNFNHQLPTFDPLEHVKQFFRDENPEYIPLEKDGVPVISNVDGVNRIVLVPKYYLPADAYRDWFYKAYPNGRIETIRHTKDPIWQNGSWVFPPEIFEVRLYEIKTDTYYMANGFANSTYKEGSEFNEVQSAISLAFKCAMRNLGFGVDITQEDINEHAPKFYETIHAGMRQIDVLPLDKSSVTPANEIIKPTAEIIAKEAAEDAQKKQIKEALQVNGVSEINSSPTPPVSPVTPISNSPCDDAEVPEFMQYLLSKDEVETIITSPAPSEDNSLDEEINNVFSPISTDTADPFPPQPNFTGSEPQNTIQNFEASPLTYEKAKEIIFETVPGYKGNYESLIGMPMGNLDKAQIRSLARATLRWEDKVPSVVREAALLISEQFN